MIVQSAPLVLKQQNQPNRECLYAWYPEVVPDTVATVPMAPRDIYIYKGLDKDLLQQNESTTNCINNSTTYDVLQRYKQSIAPSERTYHSAGTIDEALRTPWALHYELQRRPATPNLPSHSNDVPIHEEVPRRLKSAPLIRTIPSTSVLTIPEPRFFGPIVSVSTNQTPPSSSSAATTTTTTLIKPRSRASSALGRLITTVTFNEEQLNNNRREQQQQRRRESHSAQRTPKNSEIRVSNETNPPLCTQLYTEIQPQQPSVTIPSTPPPPPVYVYQRSSSWRGNDSPICCTTVETKNPVVLNPHYIRRPGVVSATNAAKRTVVQDNTTMRKPSKHRRRHHQHQYSRHSQEKRNAPMLAVAPLSYSAKVPIEIDGVKLLYNPTLTLDDPSLNLKKYLIEGRLYLIKDQYYNVVENIDPIVVETHKETLTLPPRPKYYQTIPIEKLQIPKPAPEVHYNASETFFYNTMPKRVHRYVIDPNFISENLNVNKMSLSQRPPTANVVHSTINDFKRQSTTQPTVYA